MFSEYNLEHILNSTIFDIIKRDPLDEIVTKWHKILIFPLEPFHNIDHIALNRSINPHLPVVKLLKHESEQVKDSLVEVLLITGQYLIKGYKLEVDFDKEFILADAAEEVVIEECPEDFEVVFEMAVSGFAWRLEMGRCYANLDKV